MSPRTTRNILLAASALLVIGLVSLAAHAAPACQPQEAGGTGSTITVRENAHGHALVWRCGKKTEWIGVRKGDDLPNLKAKPAEVRAALAAADALHGQDRTGMVELVPLAR